MKSVFTFLISLAFFTPSFSQEVPVDKSPLDIVYYPANYPVLKIQDKVTEPLAARLIFSRPQKNGRMIFGDLIEYDKVWRLGANEATEIELFQNVVINKVKVKKGRYTLYAIPTAGKWTIIVNKDTDSWGSFKYNKSKDVARIDLDVQPTTIPFEHFTAFFEKAPSGFNLKMMWENVMVSMPFSL